MDKEYINNTFPEEPKTDNVEGQNVGSGKISGFDAVSEGNSETKSAPVPTETTDKVTEPNETATEGFYTSAPKPTPETEEPPHETPGGFGSYFPSGNYQTEQPPMGFPQTMYTPYRQAPKPPRPPKTPKVKKERGKSSFGVGALIAVALVASIVSSTVVGVMLSGKTSKGEITSAPKKETSNQQVVKITGDIEELASTVADKASPSVVGVQTTFAVQSFFSGQSTATGSGSGVIYKSDGYIITNYHVIAEALEYSKSKITVFLNNDTENGYDASVINYNISCDLAVLKIDKTGLPAIDFADSDELKVGQYVVAIGSPAGLEFIGSTTFGIISGLNRKISTTDGNMNLIQTDAAINPGNSGGALVNAKGELIGISSSKLVDESYEGMGFAIPSNKVKEICDGLIAHEGEGDPYTGISISTNYTARILQYYGYPVGAVVASVDEGSPAAAAGIRRGDIITKFGDTEITEYTLYETSLKNYFPEDKVNVTFYRAGETKTVGLTIGSAN